MKTIRKVKKDWSEKNAKRLCEDENLLGVGIGPKERKKKLTEDIALKFFVRAKKETGLSPGERLPKTYNKIVTDVVQMAPLRANGPFTQRVRPGVGGCSGCVAVKDLIYTGTLGLGMRGYGGLSDRTLILSNNHVLANENRAKVGDPVIQPGSLDGGDPKRTEDVIGTLYDYVPLKFGQYGTNNPPVNKVDAACALVNRFGDFTREIFWVGYPTGWRSRANIENDVANGPVKVQKTGRTTGYTTGEISAVDFDGWVGYDRGDAYFEDQMIITPGSFSNPGDSGSCILDMNENIIGLLFAGSATHTIANFIEDVWMFLAPIDFSDARV